MNPKTLGIAGALIVLVIGIFAVTSGKSDETPAPASETTQAQDESAGASGGDDAVVAESEFLIPAGEREPVATFSAQTNAGGVVDNAKLAGEPYLVHVWASWCPTCNDEAPTLSRFLERNPDLAVVGVNVEDNPEAAAAYKKQYGFTYEDDIKDDNRDVQNQLGLTGQPNTLVVDADGKVAATFVGAVSTEELQKVVDAVSS